MAYEIRFSDEAVIQLQKICIYLNDNWSEKITEEFLEVLYHKLEVISSFPYSYPGSVSNIKIRKCVVTDQTSLFYEFKNNKIIILSIFDNRQSPDNIKYKENFFHPPEEYLAFPYSASANVPK